MRLRNCCRTLSNALLHTKTRSIWVDWGVMAVEELLSPGAVTLGFSLYING